MSDTSFTFIKDVQGVAQDAISVCEREIMHSFDAAVNVDGNIEGYNSYQRVVGESRMGTYNIQRKRFNL